VDDEFAQTYWEYRRLAEGDRAQRLASRKLFWAYEQLQDQIGSQPLGAVDTLVRLADSAPDDQSLAYLGAGPIEDLLASADAWLVSSFEGAARRHPRLRQALTYATLSGDAARSLRRFGSA
jgi:hypothetical protein